MLFTTLPFFILLVVTFTLYYLLKKQTQQVALLILSSFVFYAWNFPALLFLLIISIAVNLVVTYLIQQGFSRNKKMIAVIGVILNLAILFFFKYSPLIGTTFWGEASTIGQFLIAIPLPIGISFFTFQGISLVVDTFKQEKLEVQEGQKTSNSFQFILNRSLFIAFFPQLIAGPIVKAYEFLPQIEVKYLKNIDQLLCFKNIVIGYFLKTVIADNLMDQTGWMDFPHYEVSSGAHLFAMLLGYSIQIFADFAGYSLIAIGIAGLFGYYLKDNFNYPYISTSFAEFWRRWHISLSSFLREYLYIPLGGNRKGKARTYFNLMMTMVLGGLWHGAAWSYAIWGAYHGFFLMAERYIKDQFQFSIKHWLLKLIQGGFVFTIVTVGWLLFRLPNFTHVMGYFNSFYTNSFFPSLSEVIKIFTILMLTLPIIFYHLLHLYNTSSFSAFLKRWEFMIYGILFFLIVTNRGKAGAFIYFQF